MTDERWGANVTISQPMGVDSTQPVLIDLGGFGFTTGGIAINLTDAEREETFSPFYAPQGEH